jgi:hypothetical protein
MNFQDLLAKRVVQDMPEDEYHRVDALGSSLLRELIQGSPRHVIERIRNPKPANESQVLGSALHCAILQPHLFPDKFAVWPGGDRRRKEVKDAYEQFMQNHASKEILSSEQGKQVEGMVVEIMAHAGARALLQRCIGRELSLFHNDVVPTKARLDAYGHGIVLDIKTTRGRASENGFKHSIAQWSYGIQAAAYQRVLNALNIPCNHFVFVVVESEYPHCVGVYELEDEVIDLYSPKVERALQLWAECVAKDEYPAYSQEVVKIGVPAWLRRQLEEGEVIA